MVGFFPCNTSTLKALDLASFILEKDVWLPRSFMVAMQPTSPDTPACIGDGDETRRIQLLIVQSQPSQS